ncbi:lectin [Chitinophaga agrisoli]|uniref:Lectin n=1 Tax=Chitinophaga agrisoli TaxID=2607653 RepID=A0A5B2VNH8_9BACT|nr:glycoside hydrolase family 71/99-like protein [Chitinophaga agrisoli]KAA2240334.1 lectin [Chitinophaga agrisoli]
MRKTRLFPFVAIALLLFGCSKKPLQQDNVPGDKTTTGGGVAADTSSPNDVVGKVTVGYQGWFSALGDGSPNNNWGHTNLEMWPDTREYTRIYTGVPFGQGGVAQPPYTGNLGNGQPAGMFSSYDQSTVNTHFRWMQEYGIDCAALQRFANEISPGSPIKGQRDGMATRVMNAAQTYGRKFYIMYDASGWGNLTAIQNDWTNTIINTLHLTSSPAYAKQNGKPVVCVYGLGYAQHPASPGDALKFINWLKDQGLYVIGSVPGEWRRGFGDARSDFGDVWPAFNMISAWAVGRVVDPSYEQWVSGDLAYCNAHNMDYQPCAYPGTAFSNSNGGVRNGFKRNHGDFMWSQFAVMKKAGAVSVYIAMFDELNEATSIFKCAEDASMIPAGKYFLTLDADGVHVSSDFYLRETGDGGKLFKGQIPYTATCPTPFTVQ